MKLKNITLKNGNTTLTSNNASGTINKNSDTTFSVGFTSSFTEATTINLTVGNDVKKKKDLFEKLSNFGHHDEFELSKITIENLKTKINNREVFYNHFADKSSKSKWDNNFKLKKIDDNLLPIYLNENKEKFQKWFDLN